MFAGGTLFCGPSGGEGSHLRHSWKGEERERGGEKVGERREERGGREEKGGEGRGGGKRKGREKEERRRGAGRGERR